MATTTADQPTDLDSLSQRFLAELDAEPDDAGDEAGLETPETTPADGANGDAPAGAPADATAAAPSPAPAAAEQPGTQADPAAPPPAPPSAAAAPASQAASPATSPAAPPTPYTIRSGGKVHELAGVTPQPDGSLVVQADGRQRIEQLLNRGLYHETTWRATQQEYERRLTEHDAQAAEGRALRDFFAALLDEGPNAIADFLSNFEENRRDLELKMREQQLDARERGVRAPAEAAELERATQEVQQALSAALPSDLRSLAEETYPGLFQPEDLTRVAEQLGPQMKQFYVIAERDYSVRDLPPAYAAAYPEGIRAGELLLDEPALRRAIDAYAAPIQRERQRAAREAAQAKAAIAANARRTGTPGAQGAPTVTVSEGSASPPPSKKPVASRQEWMDSLLDDDED